MRCRRRGGVKDLYVIKDISYGVFPCGVNHSLDGLVLVQLEEALGNCVDMTIATPPRAALIGMHHPSDAGLRRYTVISRSQRVKSLVMCSFMGQPMILREKIHNNGQIEVTLVWAHVGNVSHPTMLCSSATNLRCRWLGGTSEGLPARPPGRGDHSPSWGADHRCS